MDQNTEVKMNNKSKKSKTIKIVSIVLAVILLFVGAFIILNNKLSSKNMENSTMNIEGKEYKTAKTIDTVDVYYHSKDGFFKYPETTIEKDTEVYIYSDKTEVIDGVEYISVIYGDNDFGYVEKSKIQEEGETSEDTNNDTTSSQTGDSYTDVDAIEEEPSTIESEAEPTDDIGEEVKDDTQEKKSSKYTSIKLDNKRTLKVNIITAITAYPTPKDADDKIIWSSSNEKVATISDTGVVRTREAGKTIITAKNSDGSVSAKCELTVEGPIKVTSITVSKNKEKIYVGDQVTIKYTLKPDNATNKKVDFITSNKSIATVSDKGVITGTGPGEATIFAIASSGKTESVKVTVVKPQCKFTSMTTSGNVLSYAVSCDKPVSLKTTKYSINGGSFVERDKSKITAMKSSITFANSVVGKKVTVRIYYGKNNDYTDKSIVLGGNSSNKSTSSSSSSKSTSSSSSSKKSSSSSTKSKTLTCNSGYLNSSRTECVKRTGTSTKSSCGNYTYRNGGCYTFNYSCPYGGNISKAYASPTCLCSKKTSYCKTKYGSRYGYATKWGSYAKVNKSPTRTYYCSKGTKRGTGANAYCEVYVGKPVYK